MSSELHLLLLGKPLLTSDGIPLMGLTLRKSVALLAYLAVTGHAHDRGTLTGLLWREASEANAQASLRKVLAELRSQVPAYLIISRTEVAFDREAPYWLDVESFEQRISLILTLHGGPPVGEDAAALEAAVELVRGDFMESFQVHGAPDFEEWVLLERERLQILCLRALETLVNYHAAQGAYAQAIAYADRMLALEPAHEDAHRTKMSLLAHSGQRAAALRQYQACRGALAVLDAEPDGGTVTLYRRIRAGAESPAPSRAPPNNLPAPLTLLVGREVELAEIGARLHDPACRLLTLVGPGGSGKTHLALEAAAAMLSADRPSAGMLTGDVRAATRMFAQVPSRPHHVSFDDGVFFVPLVAVSSADVLAPTLAQALDVPLSEWDPAERNPTRGQLLDFVRGKRLLLVLDGFEHLLAGAGLVVDLLRTAPAVKILVTSRARLDVEGEHLLPVGGLACPEPVPGDREALAFSPAVRLFVSSARRIRPGFEVTDADLVNVARICHLVGGLPLGILLAAGWAGMLSPGEIAARLSRESSQGLDLLETGRGDLPARQRSMRAVFDHSWHLLAEREQQVLSALSVLRGSFDERAAEQVAGATLRELRSLVDKSMLHQVSVGRYQLHDLLRQYAGEKLDGVPGAVETARERHASHFAATLQAQTAALKGPRQQETLAEIRAESQNLRAAWEWAAERGQVARLDQMVEGLCYFYKWRGRYEEGQRACQKAAERLSTQNLSAETPGDGLRVLARCLAWQGVFQHRLGHNAPANRLLWQSLNLLDDPVLAGQDTQPKRAFALWRLGRLTIDSDRRQARGLCQQSLALYRALGDRWGTANALNALGELAWNLGAYEEARPLFEECLATRRSLGDQRGVADALVSLSRIALYQGSTEESERLLQESIMLCRHAGNRIGVADGLLRLGRTSGFLGQFARALLQIEEAVAIYDDLGGCVPMTGVHLAAAHLHLGQYEETRAQAQMALERCREAGFSRGVGLAYWFLGREALAREAYDEAQSLLQQCVATLREIRQQDELGSALATLGIAVWRCGRPSQAMEHQYEALRTATEIRAFMPLAFALPALALLQASHGEAERAIELYSLASSYPYVANSRWFDDVVGKQIVAVASSLPPAAATAAQERGRSRDLWAMVAELSAELEEEQCTAQ